MGGLHTLSGSSPFGGASLAEKNGTWSACVRERAMIRKEKEERKMPDRRRRSTADEARISNLDKSEVELASKFVTDRTFVACCLKASVKPTVRQARKFRHGQGAAFLQLAKLRHDDK